MKSRVKLWHHLLSYVFAGARGLHREPHGEQLDPERATERAVSVSAVLSGGNTDLPAANGWTNVQVMALNGSVATVSGPIPPNTNRMFFRLRR